MNAARSDRTRRTSILITLLIAAVMGGEWILLVAGVRAHEMIVGAASVMAASAFLCAVRRSETIRLQLRASDLLTCWRIPWYILKDVYEITVVLIKDILSIKRAGSFYRVCAFQVGNHNPRLIARGVLATVYTTATPSIIILGIDSDQSRMLFHQIKRSDLPEMTQSLGARP